jgi:hypothetical protein
LVFRPSTEPSLRYGVEGFRATCLHEGADQTKYKAAHQTLPGKLLVCVNKISFSGKCVAVTVSDTRAFRRAAIRLGTSNRRDESVESQRHRRNIESSEGVIYQVRSLL